MYTEYFRRYDSSDGEAVEDIDKCLPCFDITPPFTFVVKAVHCRTSISYSLGITLNKTLTSRHVSALVISA